MKEQKPHELRNCPKCAAVLDGLRVCRVCGYKLRGPKPKIGRIIEAAPAGPEPPTPQPTFKPQPLTLTLTLNLQVTPEQLEDLLKKVANLQSEGKQQ